MSTQKVLNNEEPEGDQAQCSAVPALLHIIESLIRTERKQPIGLKQHYVGASQMRPDRMQNLARLHIQH